MSKQSQALEMVPAKKELVGVSMSAEGFEQALSEEGRKRRLLQSYIKEHLVDGTDFGKINMGGKQSKECLFKPGAEKICSLMHLKPTFSIDRELSEIIGKEVIPYVCHLVNRHTGEIEGEGRGSCSLKEKQKNANVAIKIAQKRAQIDAVLRVAALSDQFTQDLDEMEKPASSAPVTPQVKKAQEVLDAEVVEDTDEVIRECPFGKNKGTPWEEMNLKQLNFYKEYFESKIEDPEQAKYKQSNLAAYAGLMEVLNERGEL